MFEQETDGILVRVTPTFLPHESDPAEQRFVWAYAVEIVNLSAATVQLMSRYWRITNEMGVTQEVRGPGVIGEQPVIMPGAAHAYASGCPLTTPSGVMVGAYTMRDVTTDRLFDIAIPAFALDSPHGARLAN